MRWAWHIARMWEKMARGKHDRKSPLGKTRRRWENNIKIYLYVILKFVELLII